MKTFVGTAWKNSARPTAGGYGIKIAIEDRDKHFFREWKTVGLFVPDRADPIPVNVDKKSFWNGTCRELVASEIGDWMIRDGLAPWPKGYPPKIILRVIGDGKFSVSRSAH